MRRFTLVLSGLAAATLCGMSVAAAADLSVQAPRHYVEAPQTYGPPWALACPTGCWVWHTDVWDPEYSNETGHWRGPPPPPPAAPYDWAGFLAPNDMWRWR